MGQEAKGWSYDVDGNLVFPFEKVTVLTGSETGVTGQIISFGKGRGRNRFCLVKLANSIRVICHKGKNLKTLDPIFNAMLNRNNSN